MDFLKLLKSLEEFLYELCTWLVFFPRTLYRVTVHPRMMAQYVRNELDQKLEHQFDDAISPPMFLMLAVLAAHGVELALHQTVAGTSTLSRNILGNEESLLLYRSLTFAIWPLIAAVHLLRRRGVLIKRESLRKPFFVQCYLTAPFAIVISTSMTFIRMPDRLSTWIGLTMAGLACIWYVCVQAQWLRHTLQRAWPATLLATLWVLILGLLINTLIGVLLLTT